MIQVHFSHIGDTPLVTASGPEFVKPGTLGDILAEIEAHHPGLRRDILDLSGWQINSATMIFKHIAVDADGRLLEGEFTRSVRNLNEVIVDEDENLLIAVFHPERLINFLLETLTRSEDRFQFSSGDKEYRAYISAPHDARGNQKLFVEVTPEPLYPFTNGRAIRELKTDGLIDVGKNKLVPSVLLYSIARLWEIEADFRLRLFQEDALIHVLNELAQA